MKYFAVLAVILLGRFTAIYGQGLSQTDEEASLSTGFFSTVDYQVQAYFSLGGTTPLGLPREIRKIESYNPRLQLGLAANATKWLPGGRWGVRLGVAVESKGMKTEAQVKNYLTEIQNDGARVRGYFTGKVKTKVSNTYVTLPLLGVYRISNRWNLYGGFYTSFLIDGEFDGTVSDGYFKQGDPTGAQLNFEKGSGAPYDFKEYERTFQWGTRIGAEWSLNNDHFKLFPELNYGINGLFHSGFDSISFSMHNIYLSLGFGYQF